MRFCQKFLLTLGAVDTSVTARPALRQMTSYLVE